MADNTFLGGFVNNFKELLLPLKDSVQNEDSFRRFMLELGWAIPSPPVAAAQAIITSIETFVNDIASLPPDPDDSEVISIVLDIGEVFNAIKSFSNQVANTTIGIAPLQSEFISTFPEAVFNNLIAKYLGSKYPVLYSILSAFKVINLQTIEATANRPSYVEIFIDYGRLGDFISHPLDVLKSSINWDSASFEIDLVFDLLANLLSSINVPAFIDREKIADRTLLYNQAYANQDHITESLHVYLLDILIGNAFESLGIDITGSLGDTISESGVVVQLTIPDQIQLTQNITEEISLEFNLGVLIGNSLSFLIKPSGFGFKSISLANFPQSSLEVLLNYQPAEPKILIGQKEGTRLAIKYSGIGFQTSFDGGLEMAIDFDLSGLALVIDASQSDGFIKKIFGDQPKEIVFPLTVRWSSKNGISFKGSGSFEFNVNTHFKLGPIEFNDIKVSIRASSSGQSNVKAEVGTNVKGDLGPVVFNVDNIGLGLTLGLHEGNAGPFDIKLGFKPPTGVGLAIDAPPVSGGGFLNYDESTFTYTGGLELNFSKISFSAIGIISTKLPGNQPGYSLLIIITAEFGPLPLGMGFTLNGLGGILGLNRIMNPDVLRTGIRDNTLDSILFPKDIVKNANTIISNIGQAFPAKEGQFLVGPMAKIGWGTPTLLTIELGIIIELPEPVRLAILGVVKALLPSKDNAIVKIQVNFLGIIDFTNKYLSFDASLYDSQILSFGLFGDMALRLYWGDKPNFLLSVGGFHPKFTPPPLNLPELRRLTIVLANGDNLKISVETYFAVTSNSVQFGAKVAAMAKAWKIQAIGALWFDILFQFSPFYFIADMGVMFAIKMGSKTILSLFVELSLEGPNPWRAKGKGSFKILFVKVTVSFDKTFGQARVEAIEAVTIDDKVKAALTARDNWEALLPDRSNQLIAWREVDPEEDMSVDPAGALKISQRLLPLEATLQKFGSSAISDNKRYDITDVTISGVSLGYQKVQDYFARNEFFYMTDDEKLSRDSYELFDSGMVAGSGRVTAEYAVHKICDFEEITLDSGYRRPRLLDRYILTAEMYELQRFGNYINRSGLSSFDRITTSKGPNRVSVALADNEFVLVDRNSLAQVGPTDGFSNSAAAEQYLAAQLAGAPATAADWIIANRFEMA